MSAVILETPLMDSKISSILQGIKEEGGYAFASMAALAATGDARAAEVVVEMEWEQLHSAPWHSVVPIWRDAYAMACLHVAKHHYSSGEFKLSLKALHMGLIMGGSILREDLNSCIQEVSTSLRVRTKEFGDNGEGQDKLEWFKDFDLTEILKLLPVKSFSCKAVEKKFGLSLERFLQEHFSSGSPVIISGSITHWSAKDRWNDINYLKKAAGLRTAPVEVGKKYLPPVWKQEWITFSEFLERINDCSSDDITYLAQHQLFDQIQELKEDVVIPDYCFVSGGEIKSLNAWFGPPGTVTPLHHDPLHNILAQVVGKKYVRLYPASLLNELYPHSESMRNNSSQVDLDNIDETKFQHVFNLEFLDCILEEGEMLYIPTKWRH